MFSHTSVLMNESIDALSIDENKIYVDMTLGGGGHSEKILEKLQNGKGFLIGIDQDIDAINASKERLKKYIESKKLIIVKKNFEYIDKVLDDLHIDKVDGALFDIGVSSYQFDDKDRGFSYNQDALLDMRMDRDNPLTCEKVVNEFEEEELSRIIYEYSDEKFAKKIAHNIVCQRKIKRIKTTFELVDIIKKSIPAKFRYGSEYKKNPAKRTFQALRVYVNNELEVLKTALDKIVERLNDGGRIVVITFQSLEDKIVKEKFKNFEAPCTCPKNFPCVCGKKSKGVMINKKVIKASEKEQMANRRSKPAKLRIFERRVNV